MRGKPHDIMAALREERLRQGVSQGRLAEITGYSPSHIQAVESGRQGVRIEIVADLAQALGGKVRIEWGREK